MGQIRVLLVDDSPLFLATAARVLAADAALHVIGRAQSGHAALEHLARAECDLVVLDLAMPGMHGLEVARRLRDLPQPPRVIVLTLDDTTEHRAAAAVYSDAFLDKSQTATHLVPLIRSLFTTAAAG
jgi:two-component system response regulator AlgR